MAMSGDALSRKLPERIWVARHEPPSPLSVYLGTRGITVMPPAIIHHRRGARSHGRWRFL